MIDSPCRISQPSTKAKKSPILALILLPTRELAMQVLEHYFKISPVNKNDAVLVCGGLSENPQVEAIQRRPRVVVNPGRLEDYLKRKLINLRDVDILVLDEVDRMLDMGFLPAIRRIVGALPKDRQTMCYSATLDANIREIVKDYDAQASARGESARPRARVIRVTLRIYTVMQDQKLAQLDLNAERGEDPSSSSRAPSTARSTSACKLEEAWPQDRDDPWRSHSQAQRPSALKKFSDGKLSRAGCDRRCGARHRPSRTSRTW